MRLATSAVIGVAVLCCTVSLARAQQGAVPPAPPAPPAGGWKLLSGLTLDMRALDISPDSKLAMFWGTQKADPQPRRSCWIVDLASGRIDDLLALAGDKTAAAIGECRDARFSPGGTHVGIVAADGKHACIIELATHKAVVVSGAESHYSHMAWAGERLILSTGETKPVEAYDLAGKRVESVAFKAEVLRGDQPGRKLLARMVVPPAASQASERARPVLAVINPEGKVIREIGSTSGVCPWDIHVLSRQGGYAAAVLLPSGPGNPAGVYLRVVPTGGGEEIAVRPWGFTVAVAETGEGVIMRSRTGASRPTVPIEFWGRDGKSRELVKNAMAGAIVGDSLFVIQSDGDTPALNVVPLPKGPGAAPPPPAAP